MRRSTFLTVTAFAIAALLAGGTLVASNMGFKLNYRLPAAGDSVVPSGSGTITLGLPFNRQSGLDTAKNLMDDIGFANVALVKRWIEATDTFETYTGRRGTPNPDFPLATAEGYFVQMNASVDYIIVGSHDPAFAVDLQAADGGVTSASGTNFYAYPYHSTASMSKELMDDIGFASVALVKRWLTNTDNFETYTGRRGTPNDDFPLKPGEAYFIQMNSSVSYVPSHY